MAYYVYLLASRKHGTLYLGVTKDIVRRGYEHRTKAVDGFTTRYGVDKLVWFADAYRLRSAAYGRRQNHEAALADYNKAIEMTRRKIQSGDRPLR
jgi:predicted GIY-YIG superfamily endonuclease